ncbi:MAG: hypothetical protein JXQ73_28560 [Phycisphaerae bacterium]|nr:hypothetical protein [Phycisphaerae bacterium]
MSDPAHHVDPTFGRPDCRPGADPPTTLPLPLRIWTDEAPAEPPVTLSCAFPAKGACTNGVLWATADGDFTIRANTTEIGRIENNHLARKLMRFDLDGMIKHGVNTIEIDVTPSGSAPHCLLAVVDAELNGEHLRIVSDEKWSVRTGQNQARPAVVVGKIGSEPWGFPAGGPDDLYRGSFGDLRLLPLPAVKIVAVESGSSRIDAVEAMLSPDDSAATVTVESGGDVRPPWIDLSAGWRYSHLRREFENQQLLSWLSRVRQEKPSVLIDFGREINARLRVDLAEPITGTIAVVADETPQAVDGYDTAFCQVLECDGTRTAVTEITGMRYARLIFLSADRPVHVKAVTADMIYYPVEYRGSFSCNDSLLTRIWDVGAYTLHACMQDYVWDGIKRDQLPWMGDAHLEHLGIYYAFGDATLPRRTLEWLRWHGPPETSINGIDGYSMWWVSGLYNHLLFTGDRGFLADQQQALLELLEAIEAMLEGGLYAGKSPFIDHAPIVSDEQDGQVAGTQMLAVRALKEGSMLLGVLGDSPNAVRFMDLAGRVRAAAMSKYWSDEAGDFGPYRQVNALAIFCGVAEGDQAAAVARKRLSESTGNPMTTWQHYYMYEALAQTDMHRQALDIMREYYGAMLSHGATTFWETYDESWQDLDVHRQLTTHVGYGGYRISLCHGWAAGPVPWLSGHVLGICPLRPGFSHCRIQPRPFDLKWFSGKVPTPNGEVCVDAERDPSGWRVAVDVPPGVLPNLDVSYFEPLAGLTLNGQAAELA